jgi:acetyltransferase
LPAEANPNNPLDLLAGAGPDHYRKSLELLLKDNNVDAVLLINVPPIMIDPVEVATTVTEVASHYQKPVVGCFMGIQDILRTIQDTKRTIIPLYAFPESAAKALNALVRYRHLREQLHSEPKILEVQKQTAAQILDKAVVEKRTTLRPAEIVQLLQAYGIPTAPVVEVHTLEETILQARKMGYPLVMKAIMETKQHKSEFGGVTVDLRTDSEIIEAYEVMMRRIREQHLEKDWQGFYLQPMIKGGKEVILGKTMDPTFGPLLMFGMGGIYVETMKDVTFRIIPITENDSKNMIESIRGYPLLKGVRGEPPVDLNILQEALQRLSQLCNDFPVIKEIEINPFFISSRKDFCLALDSRVYL